MRRRRNRGGLADAPEVESAMTPMIDVVFQLLIYFLVTFSAADLLGELKVQAARPAEGAAEQPVTDPIFLEVSKERLTVNGRAVSLEQMGEMLSQLVTVGGEQSVAVLCEDEVRHHALVAVLDLCAEAGLEKVSLVKRGGGP
jgi:biopolymer transport protein ExbD